MLSLVCGGFWFGASLWAIFSPATPKRRLRFSKRNGFGLLLVGLAAAALLDVPWGALGIPLGQFFPAAPKMTPQNVNKLWFRTTFGPFGCWGAFGRSRGLSRSPPGPSFSSISKMTAESVKMDGFGLLFVRLTAGRLCLFSDGLWGSPFYS